MAVALQPALQLRSWPRAAPAQMHAHARQLSMSADTARGSSCGSQQPRMGRRGDGRGASERLHLLSVTSSCAGDSHRRCGGVARKGFGHRRRAGDLPRCSTSDASTAVQEDSNEEFKEAAKVGNLNRLRELVGSGKVDVNLPSTIRSGWTALQLGAFYGHSEVIAYLLWAGANTEVRNNSGNTALQFACLKGNVEIARMLLEAGADLDAVSNDKGTPFDYAQEWGGEEIVDYLTLWAANSSG